MKKTINKSVLKENYYYECEPFYDALPEVLTVPDYQSETFAKAISHRDILKEYEIEPYKNIADAFAVIADCVPTLGNDYNGRLAYFIDKGTTFRLSVFRNSDGRLRVYILKVYPDSSWNAGYGVLFSNGTSDTSTAALENFVPLALSDEQAIMHLKNNGYKITKEF